MAGPPTEVTGYAGNDRFPFGIDTTGRVVRLYQQYEDPAHDCNDEPPPNVTPSPPSAACTCTRVWSVDQTPRDAGRARLPQERARVMTGITDAAIARHLTTSERTVRRHVGLLTDHLGAPYRVSLAWRHCARA